MWEGTISRGSPAVSAPLLTRPASARALAGQRLVRVHRQPGVLGRHLEPGGGHRCLVRARRQGGPGRFGQPELQSRDDDYPDYLTKREGEEEEAALLAADMPSGRKLESEKLPREVRQKVEDAVERLNGKATVGDVSSLAGLPPGTAESALNALAADVQGTLKVSSAGDVVYELPRGFKGALRARSTLMRLEPTFEKVKGVANYLVRVLFGGTLFVSIAAVPAAITILLTAAASGGSDRDDRRGNRGGGGMAFFMGPRPMFGGYYGNPFYWADPWYYQRPRVRLAASRGEKPRGILEGIFSFVFGDGNPNALREARKWEKVGQYIVGKGGVVTAEELAPFLDPSARQLEEGDEGYVVPALVRFDGVSEVSPSGQLLYRFPSLQRTASQEKGRWALPRFGALRQTPEAAMPEADLEKRWTLSNVDGGTKALAIGLGVFNVAAVAYLTSLLGQPGAYSVLFQAGAGWIVNIFPALQLYAAAFFAIPLLRSLQNGRRNAVIEAGNEARRSALRLLASPTPTLRNKLQEAAKGAERVIVSDEDIVYRSDRPLPSKEQSEEEEWEARLRARDGGRGGEGTSRSIEPTFEERLDRLSSRDRLR